MLRPAHAAAIALVENEGAARPRINTAERDPGRDAAGLSAEPVWNRERKRTERHIGHAVDRDGPGVDRGRVTRIEKRALRYVDLDHAGQAVIERDFIRQRAHHAIKH